MEYHRDTVLGGTDDFPGQTLAYYGSRGQTPMRWGPGAAERLGLAGSVTPGQFDALFGPGARRDPVTGEVLAATSRPGFELVVAAHKSVAILGVIGRAEDMHAILDAERDATLGYLNALMAERGGRRGRAEIPTATGGLVWCHTRHATTRAGDPGPHDHVLIANLTEMLDDQGGWRGLHSSYLRDHVHAATMYGRMAAARVAVERGYRIEADPGHSGRLRHWRLAGILVEVERLFSKRKTEIDDYLEERGFSSHRARNIAARKTRAAKTQPDMTQLMTRWTAELADAGWIPERLLDRLDHATPMLDLRRALRAAGAADRPLVGGGPSALGDDGVARIVAAVVAAEGPLALASHSRGKAIGRRDIVVAVAPFVYGLATGELDRVVDAVIANAELVPLLRRGTTKDRHWVLASVLAAEQAVELAAEALATAISALVPPAVVDAAVGAAETRLGRPLTDEQRATARAVVAGGAALDVVVGVAGAGKTTVLAAVGDAYQAAGWRVIGAATAGQAAHTLDREAGMPALTVGSMLWRLDHGRLRLDPRTLVILDEAGMTGDLELAAVLDHVQRAGAKAVVVGDPRQLSPVGPGGGLAAVARRHPHRIHPLRRNVRQRTPGEARALAHLRAGDPDVAIDWYRSRGRIHIEPSRDDLLDAITGAWAGDIAAGRHAVLYAWRRNNVAELNQRARQQWRRLGRLTGPELEVNDRAYAVGDRVVILASDPTGNLTASARGHVVAVNPGKHWLDVCFDDGTTCRLTGDQLANDRLDWGYALTVHRSQGDTVDIAHRLNDGGGRELAYVAASRGRLVNHQWLVADDQDEAVEQLLADWTSERSQTWAVDIHTPAPGLPAGVQPAQRIGDAVHRARLRAERDRLRSLVADQPGHDRPTHVGSLPWAHGNPDLARRLRFLENEIRRLDDRVFDYPPTGRPTIARSEPQRGLGLGR
ncbi:MAG: MobF family relaxase [Acidimicrobiales bacterium]